MKFFLRRDKDAPLIASELVVEWPERFHGFPGRPLPPDSPIIYQAVARFPGVLPSDGMSNRRESNFHALLGLINSIEQFCMDFEKAGGTIYFAMPEDETKPFLGEPMKAKRFFRV